MKNFIWKVKQFLIGTFDDNAKWWCSNCGLLPSHYNDIMGEKNPHYCPQCGSKIVDYDEELPLTEPDVTDEDFRKSMSVVQIQGTIVIDGVELPPCPSKSKWTNSTIINNKVYVNGYEYKDGEWKRTLKALWHLIF